MQDPVPDGDDEVAVLCNLDERPWLEQAASWVGQPQQRFGTHDPPIAQVEYGLVVQLEKFLVDRPPKVELNSVTLPRSAVEHLVVGLPAVTAPALGFIEGSVGVAQQFARVG